MGICEDAPDEYCGHVLEPEDTGSDGEADDNWHETARNAVCLREPTYDGLCVWHADTDEKTVEELVESRLTPEDVPWEAEYVKEHLNGAILRRIGFPEGFSFGGCVLLATEFPDADLRSAEFPDANLGSAEFPNADLTEAEFPNADLVFAKFPNADLIKAEFPNADLPSAKFPDSELTEAEFSDSELSGAEFPNAHLKKAEFPNAHLKKAEFPNAHLKKAEFPNAHLKKAEFPDTNLRFAEFPNADLTEAEFPNADLLSTKFPNADLIKAEFPNADLRSAKFHDSNLSIADFLDSDLKDAEFSRAKLIEAEFIKTDLRGINFTEVSLQETVFFEADLRYTKFRPAYTRAVDPEKVDPIDPLGASLEDAQFEGGTDLRGADLSGARLYQTAFRDVRINNKTTFGIEDENPYGRACRYEYDLNIGVSINEDVPRLRAAVWTHRRLESLFEQNAMDQRARDAHIRKEEAQRTHYKEQMENDDRPQGSRLKSLGQYAVSTLNWHLHRHGESLRQLLKVSALLILGCGVLYPFVGGIDSSQSGGPYRITSLIEFVGPEGWVDVANGVYFSAITFTTIGYGDFYPAGPGSRILVAVESLAGALLIALFVFVIGRRVAR